MSYDEFWNQDVELAKFYRQAWNIKQDIKNHELWLQGAYIYEAILCASPVLHDFAKKGTKPVPYPDSPYELRPNKKDKKTEKTEKEQKSDKKAKAIMEMWMVAVNKKFEKAGGGGNG